MGYVSANLQYVCSLVVLLCFKFVFRDPGNLFSYYSDLLITRNTKKEKKKVLPLRQ